MSQFTSYYDPAAATVTMVTHLGEMRVASTVSLATYLVRQHNWPGLYPESALVAVKPPIQGSALKSLSRNAK